ncbi:hypothetical protein ACWFR5_30480 [Streptomyces sp. NPDC055092]
MLLRLAYLGVTNAFTMLRLLPMSDYEKDVEILALRHQIALLERQLNGQQVRFHAIDRAFLASLLRGLAPADKLIHPGHPLPAGVTDRGMIALAECLIQPGGSGFRRRPSTLKSSLSRGSGGRGMMISRVTETGGCDECVRDASTAADGRS